VGGRDARSRRPRPRLCSPRYGVILDPTSDPVDNTLTKVGVDATKPGVPILPSA